jgi:hypothetical protein
MSSITIRSARRTYCGYSSKYKGLRYPECDGGMPCTTCLQKYKETQAKLARKKEQKR